MGTIEAPGGQKPSAPEDVVLAPGYQAYLLPGPPAARVRWRTVRSDGTRFRPVSELGVIIAQVRALVRVDGCAWVVGSDEHTIEIRSHAEENSASEIEVRGIGPRWTYTIATAVHR
jgi:hypothetical protein